MPRPFLLLVLAALAVSACGDASDAGPAASGEALTSADAVADAMLARYAANLGDVEAFAVQAEGVEARYTLSGDTTGLDRFAPPQVGPVGDGPVPSSATRLLYVQVPNVPRMARGLRTAALDGPLTRDGRRVYALSTDDPGAVFGEPGLAPPDTTGTRDFRVYVGADDFNVYEIYQLVSADSLGAITSRIIYSDFREADGVTLPFSVRQIETGLNLSMGQDERMVIGGQLGINVEQLKQAPASPERDARLAELQAQQRIVAEGVSELTLEVEEVRVGAED